MPVFKPRFRKTSLKNLNTFGVDVAAPRFVEIEKPEQFTDLMNRQDLWVKSSPPLILGGGSNVLFVSPPERIVIANRIHGIEIVKSNQMHAWVKAGAGVVWHDLVDFALFNKLGGIENLSFIPGLCGAAPIQNIGAYGVELEEVFDHLEALDLTDGTTHIFKKKDCKFGYRSSIFKTEYKNRFMITSITLRLMRHPILNTSYGAIAQVLEEKGIAEPTIRDVSRAVIKIRRDKLPDPRVTGNAGSFFKNPVVLVEKLHEVKDNYPDVVYFKTGPTRYKIPAGWLIEKCGWKGKKIGNVGTWHLQSLVIVNHGTADGRAILDFARNIRDDVLNRFGISLEPEVNIIGEDF